MTIFRNDLVRIKTMEYLTVNQPNKCFHALRLTIPDFLRFPIQIGIEKFY